MSIKTFKGGIHPHYKKELTNAKPVVLVEAGPLVVIPLQQHIGKICSPLVKKGDYVKVGQRIGDADAFVSAPVHSSVSGKVLEIEPMPYYNGAKVNSVIIENDFQNIMDESVVPAGNYEDMSPDEIVNTIHRAGIVGMGGAGFPMHIKINPPKNKCIKYVILNGAECEPYLSTDHRTMLEHVDEMLFGINVLLHITKAKRAFIAVEDNKPDVIELLLKKNLPYNIEVVPLETKYPQGSEKQIIKSVTGIEVPHGALPADVGVIVNNVDTCVSLYNIFIKGIPCIRKRVTVSGGAVKNPGVYDAPLGVSFKELFEAAGGFTSKPAKIIMGGPMMGSAQISLDAGVIKTTSGILAFTAKEARKYTESPCLRCGKCVDVCPMHLMPTLIEQAERRNDLSAMEKLCAKDCIECGSCSYICPSHRYLVERVKLAKNKVQTLSANRK